LLLFLFNYFVDREDDEHALIVMYAQK